LAFYLAAGAGVAAFLILVPIHEDRRTPQAPSVKGFLVLLGRRDVIVPSLLSLIGQYANWGATFGFIPILAKQLGATDVLQSALVSLNIAVVTIGNLLAGTITKKVPTQRLVLISFVLIGLGLAGATWAPSLGWIFAVQVCLGLAQGIGYPVLMGLSIREVDDAERATAMGLHQAIYAVGMFAGPALSGTFASALGLRPMFALTAAACLALGLAGTRFLKADGS
ncbi:MAG: MFS transporter, partial [Chloroflexi bacterium]|nr:MFS transporter [Chloroflexota bacterium]